MAGELEFEQIQVTSPTPWCGGIEKGGTAPRTPVLSSLLQAAQVSALTPALRGVGSTLPGHSCSGLHHSLLPSCAYDWAEGWELGGSKQIHSPSRLGLCTMTCAKRAVSDSSFPKPQL